MNKNKFLIALCIGLLLVNAVLFFMLMKEHGRHGGPKTIIIEKLHFDKEQIKQYEVYIHKHRKDINDNEEITNKLRTELYKQLNLPQDTAKIDSLIGIIAQQQIVAEKINYKHFIEIKKLCKPSQQKNFEKLTIEIAELFSKPKRK